MKSNNTLRTTDTIIKKYGAEKGALISVLQDIQAKYRYLPKDSLKRVAERMNIPMRQVFGVATFYSAFSLKPVGKNLVQVCSGTACHVRGTERVVDSLKRNLGIEVGETTRDNLFSLREVRCIGCCSLAPAVMINDDTYGRLTSKKIPGILANYKKGTKPKSKKKK